MRELQSFPTWVDACGCVLILFLFSFVPLAIGFLASGEEGFWGGILIAGCVALIATLSGAAILVVFGIADWSRKRLAIQQFRNHLWDYLGVPSERLRPEESLWLGSEFGRIDPLTYCINRTFPEPVDLTEWRLSIIQEGADVSSSDEENTIQNEARTHCDVIAFYILMRMNEV